MTFNGNRWLPAAPSAGGSSSIPGTGLLKGVGGVGQSALVSDIFALFGSCSGIQYPGFDGSCHTPSGSAVWGGITGTLSSQTDLFNALTAKQNAITPGSTSQYLKGDFSLGTFPVAGTGASNYAAGNDSRITGAVQNPMTTVGDTVIGGASGVPARLAPGVTGTVLTSNGVGVAPSYQPAALSQIAIGPIASTPACNANFLYLPTDGRYNQVAGDGTSCHYLLAGKEMFPANATTFPSVFQAQNGMLYDVSSGTADMTIYDNASCCNWTGRVAALPAHPNGYTITQVQSADLVGSNQTFGLGILDGGVLQSHIEMITSANAGSMCSFRVVHVPTGSDGGTQMAATAGLPIASCTGGLSSLKIVDSGSTLSYYYSLQSSPLATSPGWVLLFTEPSTGGFITPTKYGFLGTSNTAGANAYLHSTVLSLKILTP